MASELRCAVLAVSGLVLLSSGCPRRYTDGPPKANRLRSGHAPTPFSADQIRDSCQIGVWRLYRVSAVGKPDSYRILRFAQATDAGAVVVSAMTDAGGKPFGEQRRVRALWKGLQAHASFPEKATTIRTEKRTTPAGTFTCWRYDVSGRGERKRFWFAKDLPGPPVDLIRWVRGRQVMRMTLVARGRSKPRPAPRPR